MSDAWDFALFGKHPAFGDFLTRRLEQPFLGQLEHWLDAALTQARDSLGEVWQSLFDNARPLRFWLGSDLTGQGALAGVMIPSRDKVGRRFPLLILAPADLTPPTMAPDQSLHDRLTADLGRVLAADPAAFSASPAPLAQTVVPAASVFWATNPVADAAGLLAATAEVDHQRASQSRSYWWCDADQTRSAAVYASTGYPDGSALAWLWTGVARQTDALEQNLERDMIGD